MTTALKRHHRIKMLTTGVWKASLFRWKNRTDVYMYMSSACCCIWQMRRILTRTETRHLISASHVIPFDAWVSHYVTFEAKMILKSYMKMKSMHKLNVHNETCKVQSIISKSRLASHVSINIIRLFLVTETANKSSVTQKIPKNIMFNVRIVLHYVLV